MEIPSGKTKIEMQNHISGAIDQYYIDGYVQGADSVPYAIVVRLSDGDIDFASPCDMKAIAINDN